MTETASDWAGHFSPAVLSKARRLSPEEVRQDAEHPTVYWVRGSRPDRPYRVQVHEGFATCSCPNGGMTGGAPRCYHLAAVLLSTGHAL